MTKEDFFNKCATHDWFFQNSDSSTVYMRGRISEDALFAASNFNPLFEKIYNDWNKYMHSGELFGTTKLPKPKIEDYE